MFAKHYIFSIFALLALTSAFAYVTPAQSSSQEYPTPITQSEISGTIKSRDVGDPRLTTYFYVFGGNQGDLFINLMTRNFTGDFDIFVQPGLRSLTKIVVYAESSDNETGRVIYLRKNENLLLRVQGRSPNDDPAEFRLKFAGSFVAANPSERDLPPDLPKVRSEETTGIKVNSVGTIIEEKAKIRPVEDVPATETEVVQPQPTEAVKEEKATEEKTPTTVETTEKTSNTKVEVVVSDSLPKETPDENLVTKPKPTRTTRRRRAAVGRQVPKATVQSETDAAATEPPPTEEPKPAVVKKPRRPGRVPKVKLPDPLADIRLIILFKDGRTIERPMSEVFRFTVDRGILTVISKDGTVGRYPILEVAKVTIE
ncbi:MAG: hypothetical protein ACT4O9_17620 [Blastocatellia bacterium]